MKRYNMSTYRINVSHAIECHLARCDPSDAKLREALTELAARQPAKPNEQQEFESLLEFAMNPSLVGYPTLINYSPLINIKLVRLYFLALCDDSRDLSIINRLSDHWLRSSILKELLNLVLEAADVKILERFVAVAGPLAKYGNVVKRATRIGNFEFYQRVAKFTYRTPWRCDKPRHYRSITPDFYRAMNGIGVSYPKEFVLASSHTNYEVFKFAEEVQPVVWCRNLAEKVAKVAMDSGNFEIYEQMRALHGIRVNYSHIVNCALHSSNDSHFDLFVSMLQEFQGPLHHKSLFKRAKVRDNLRICELLLDIASREVRNSMIQAICLQDHPTLIRQKFSNGYRFVWEKFGDPKAAADLACLFTARQSLKSAKSC